MKGAVLDQILQAGHPHPDRLDKPYRIERADSVQVFRQKTKNVLRKNSLARTPKSWIVVAQEVPVFLLGYVVEISNIARVKLARIQTFQEVCFVHQIRRSVLYAGVVVEGLEKVEAAREGIEKISKKC